MSRVPSIAGSYFDFGAEVVASGSQASSNAPSEINSSTGFYQ
jgi:hypothetical protein